MKSPVHGAAGYAAGLAVFAWALAAPASPAAATPKLFAPGHISTTVGVDCLSFTPDGNTVFFHQAPWGGGGMIMVSHRANGYWSTPRIAAFSGRWADHDPAMAPDGSYLIFASNRPVAAGGKPVRGGNLWRVNRKGTDWSRPVHLPETVNFGSHVYAPSIAANGDLYFQSRDNSSNQFHIYRSRWRDSRYQEAVRLKLGAAGAHELDPAIAPDESFVVFDMGENGGKEPDHLYIAFREGGNWSNPVDLGAAIDRYQPWGARLGPDGKTLYFSSNYVEPAHFPRTRAQARADLTRIRVWNNGVTHIWSVSLVPWLDMSRG